MYIVANRLPIADSWSDKFESRFQQRVDEIEKQPGLVRMQILKPQFENSPYIVLTTWKSESYFNQWLGSDDFKLAHENPLPKEAFTGRPIIERHNVVIFSKESI